MLYGIPHVVMGFVINETSYVVLFRKTGYQSVLVLVSSAPDVVGHADIKRTVAFARHDVNEIGVHAVILEILDPTIKPWGLLPPCLPAAPLNCLPAVPSMLPRGLTAGPSETKSHPRA